jgi:hypothetical protein
VASDLGVKREGDAVARNPNEIRTREELPTWFSLKKYDGAKDLDSQLWLAHIRLRQSVQNEIKRDTSLEEKIKHTNDFLWIIQNHPVAKKGELKELDYWIDNLFLKNIDQGLRAATILDIYLLYRDVGKEKFDGMTEWLKGLDSGIPGHVSRFGPSPDYSELEVDNFSHCYGGIQKTIIVNPMLPDELLINQFKEFLVDFRKKNEVLKIKTPAFDRWVSSSALPYIDLTIWADLAGVSIPNRVMADAIFNEGEGGEEDVRKTTMKWAKALMDSATADTLEAMIAG